MPGDWVVKQASVILLNYPLGYQHEQAKNDLSYVWLPHNQGPSLC